MINKPTFDDAVSKAEVLETYADLYDVFEDNKEICKELHRVYDRLNNLSSSRPEIIRCEDCKFTESTISDMVVYCTKNHSLWSSNESCSRGRKKVEH